MKMRTVVVSLLMSVSVGTIAYAASNSGAAAGVDDSAPGLRGLDHPTSQQPPAATPTPSVAPPESIDRVLADTDGVPPATQVFPGARDPSTVAVFPTPPVAGSPPEKDADKMPHEAVSVYGPALACVAGHLTPFQRGLGWSVGDIPDRSGQINSIADAGTGTFSTQGIDDIMIDSLTRAGVTVIDSSPVMQQRTEYYMGKAAVDLVGDGNTYILSDKKTGKPLGPISILRPYQGTVVPPRYLVNGAISQLDFVPGGGINIQAVAQIQHIVNAMRVGMVMRVVQMAVGPQLGGQVVASDRIEREVESVQNQVGASSFFRSPIYYSLTIGYDRRQALQAAEVALSDRFAAILVAKTYNVTVCDSQIAYADKLAFSAQ